MCVIIDANLAFRIFTPALVADFRPVFEWLHAPDKNGCLVFGGKLSNELSHRTDSRRYLVATNLFSPSRGACAAKRRVVS